MIWKTALRKPRWQHRKPEIRAEAVAHDDDAELIASLASIAVEDEDSTVRAAALQRIDDLALLDRRSREESDEKLRQLAERRLRHLVCGSEVDLQQRLDFVRATSDKERIEIFVRQAEAAELRRAAIGKVERQGLLGDRVLADEDPGVRHAALERIEQPSTLNRIAEILRTKDKQLYREVEQRLQSLGGQHTEVALQEAEGVCSEMEALARGGSAGRRAQALADIQARWAPLAAAAPETLRRRFEGALAIVERSLAPPAPAPEKPEVEAELSAQAEDNPVPERSAEVLEAMPSAEEKATGRSDGAKADKAKTPAGPDVEQLHEALDALLNQMEQAVDADDLAAAKTIQPKALKLVDQLKQRRRFNNTDNSRRWLSLQGRVRELRGWQRWSNDRIRKRLIREIEALGKEGLHPDAVLTKIKQSRAQWDALNEQEQWPGEAQRRSSPALWRHFNAICKETFERAKPFFEKRSELRQQKLEETLALAEQLDQVLQSSPADWKALQQARRNVIDGLKQLEDLAPQDRKKAARRLRKSLDRASAAIDSQYDEVEKRKRGLIRLAERLPHVQDRAEAINEAKKLNREWKDSGSLPRRREQGLWEAFRAPIDPLFEAQREQSAKEQQARDENRAALQALCEEMEGLAALEGDDLRRAGGRAEGLLSDWREADVRDRGLQTRFDQAHEKFLNRVAAAQHDREQIQRRALRDYFKQLLAAESRADGGQPLSEELLGNLQDTSLASGGGKLSQALLERRDALLRAVDNDTVADYMADTAEATDSARDLCVNMEFLAGLNSPPEDQARRMDFQVQRLSESLGGGESGSQREEALAAEQDWYLLAPLAADQATALNDRFVRALDEVLKQYN